jgi:hypothetical protein
MAEVPGSYPLRYNAGSVSALYLEMLRENGSLIAHGTGFVGYHQWNPHTWVLFTARHNFSGKGDDAAHIPSKVRIFVPELNRLAWDPVTLDLRSSDWKPLWYEHPSLREKVDVAALVLNPSDMRNGGIQIGYHAIDEFSQAQRDLRVTQKVHVIGHPIKRDGDYQAIWTTGHLASEPLVDFFDPHLKEKLPYFLVNCRTWSGQSGSPVVRYDDWHPFWTRGSWQRRVGAVNVMPHMYTGRLHPSSEHLTDSDNPAEIRQSSDIGIVWKSSVLIEIFQSIINERRSNDLGQ